MGYQRLCDVERRDKLLPVRVVDGHNGLPLHRLVCTLLLHGLLLSHGSCVFGSANALKGTSKDN